MTADVFGGFDWNGEFVWDEAKRRSNLAKHHVDFRLAEDLFADANKLTEQSDIPGEFRFKTVAATEGRIYVVIWTPRGRRIRVISMRRARD